MRGRGQVWCGLAGTALSLGLRAMVRAAMSPGWPLRRVGEVAVPCTAMSAGEEHAWKAALSLHSEPAVSPLEVDQSEHTAAAGRAPEILAHARRRSGQLLPLGRSQRLQVPGGAIESSAEILTALSPRCAG